MFYILIIPFVPLISVIIRCKHPMVIRVLLHVYLLIRWYMEFVFPKICPNLKEFLIKPHFFNLLVFVYYFLVQFIILINLILMFLQSYNHNFQHSVCYTLFQSYGMVSFDACFIVLQNVSLFSKCMHYLWGIVSIMCSNTVAFSICFVYFQ